MIPVTIAVIFLVYLIMHMTPGDPVASMLGADATPELIAETRSALGIDDPFLIQFGRYVLNLFRGNFGTSWYTGDDVSIRLFAAIPYTVKVSLLSMTLALLISIPIGISAALNHNTVVDYAVSVFSIIGVSSPAFWIATLLVLGFALSLGILPATYDGTWRGYVMPCIALCFNHLAGVTRTTRSSMLEVLKADYIRTARAKGVSKFTATYKHALRNAIIPSITVAGLNFGSLIAGTVAIENVFAIPGVGRLMIDNIKLLDTPTVLGCIVFVSVMVSIINLLVDLLYAVIDPRIKSQYLKGGKK